ncbi:hypothetical protein P872_06360 [Rhodonellum psychrophilum GCM71 = DSM 17998]|uniref:Uncharacterized protein n=2 Tax=Rhodonellum TaxID=336827 RepID=U5C4G0_9BACT|nr:MULTISPECIES: hypothetical protein [Rhodonellum]ERM83092.1 hypothetical protein P872_06360 [Rhodonellum psychrophilum GCM71 = DSM 17998]SDZ46902.1 hypothetical protein SAMN05444412_1161 [Rhodonellum ikkaensis]
MENTVIREIYRKLERNVLIQIAIPLPFFAISYLYTKNGTIDYGGFNLASYWNSLTFGLVIALLIFQLVHFTSATKKIIKGGHELDKKFSLYAEAVSFRFWILFLTGFISAAGLYFLNNPNFTIAFAVTLVFISLGKPSPDRVASALKLKGEEKDLVMDLKRRI